MHVYSQVSAATAGRKKVALKSVGRDANQMHAVILIKFDVFLVLKFKATVAFLCYIRIG